MLRFLQPAASRDCTGPDSDLVSCDRGARRQTESTNTAHFSCMFMRNLFGNEAAQTGSIMKSSACDSSSKHFLIDCILPGL